MVIKTKWARTHLLQGAITGLAFLNWPRATRKQVEPQECTSMGLMADKQTNGKEYEIEIR